MDSEEELKILQEFGEKILTQSKDLDPLYYEFISEHFWELV